MLKTWLEKKLNNFRWQLRWQSREIRCHRHYVSPDLTNFFHQLNLPTNAHVLAPLCGKSKDLQWLATQGYQVTGVELSAIACQSFFTEMHVTPQITQQKHFTRYQHNYIELLCGDFFKLSTTDLPAIDAIYDCAALVALPKDLRQQYVEHLLACCSGNVKILLIGFSTTDHVKGPPFSISAADINHLFAANFKIQVLKQELLKEIPAHLAEKGFQQITRSVYLMTKPDFAS